MSTNKAGIKIFVTWVLALGIISILPSCKTDGKRHAKSPVKHEALPYRCANNLYGDHGLICYYLRPSSLNSEYEKNISYNCLASPIDRTKDYKGRCKTIVDDVKMSLKSDRFTLTIYDNGNAYSDLENVMRGSTNYYPDYPYDTQWTMHIVAVFKGASADNYMENGKIIYYPFNDSLREDEVYVK